MKKDNRFATWLEIPVLDMNRAVSFYNTVFDIDLKIEDHAQSQMAVLAQGSEITGAALVKRAELKPSAEGMIIYLNAGKDIEVILKKVKSAGGKIILSKTKVSGDYGYHALFLDSEGNRLGLHHC